MGAGKTIEKSAVRTDSLAKVTGQARYTADMKLPGMLVAEVLRSHYAHARIRAIDLARAPMVPVVKTAVEAYAMVEPYAVVAHYNSGYLDLWMPNASPHVRAKALSNLLKIPLNRVRVKHIFSGGYFQRTIGPPFTIKPGEILSTSSSRRRKREVVISR